MPWACRQSLSSWFDPRRTQRRTVTESDTSQAEFDASRALLLQADIFPPFRVEATRPLRDALADGDVREDALVLVAERSVATIVLLTRQLTYHHVAQGQAAGEPWMVSY
jgi:hypothetical protein